MKTAIFPGAQVLNLTYREQADMAKNSKTILYEALFEYADDGITVTFPDLPGCITCGVTEEEALVMAKDALSVYIAAFRTEKEQSVLPADFPSPSEGTKVFYIEHDVA